MQRSSLRPENALSLGLMRREAVQLSVIAVASAVPLLLGSRVLSVIATVADVIAALLGGVAGIVAWRVAGRGGAVVFYLGAVLAFAVLALLNLRH